MESAASLFSFWSDNTVFADEDVGIGAVPRSEASEIHLHECRAKEGQEGISGRDGAEEDRHIVVSIALKEIGRRCRKAGVAQRG